MFPSTLLGTGEKWTLMKSISVTEYLNYESGVLFDINNDLWFDNQTTEIF